MTTQTTDLLVTEICDRVFIHGMANAVTDGQANHPLEVVLGQFHFTVEDCDQVLVRERLRRCLRAVTLEAKLVRSAGSKQVIVVPAVRFVTGRATCLKRRRDARCAFFICSD